MEILLDTLRRKTSQLHQGLHGHPVLKSCQEGTLSKSEYVHLLKAFYSPWKLLGPMIDQVPITPLRPKLHSRFQAIKNDLLQLGVNDSTFRSLKPNTKLNKDQLLGICYVLIGSSMGGTMLSEKIRESLGDVPISYMAMTPKEAGWPELVAKLRTFETKDYAGAPVAAHDAFELVGKELTIKRPG